MDVCAKLRGILKERRIGHGGTLDPMATGVLPVFVGNATKAAQYAENSIKEYIGILRLGMITDTQDITGNILETRDINPDIITPERVKNIMREFTGEMEQTPPMYSAVKINGKKLYQLARKGKEIPRPPRKIKIYELELLNQDLNQDKLLNLDLDLKQDLDLNQENNKNNLDFAFRCRCSKGVYIRTLCHDMGLALGCGGVLYALRRTMAAGFREVDAVSLEYIEKNIRETGDYNAFLRPVDSLFDQYPAFTVPTPEAERKIRHGNPIKTRIPDGIYRVYAPDGAFLCLSEAKNGVLTSQKNFF